MEMADYDEDLTRWKYILISLIPIVLLLLYLYCRYKLNYWKRLGVLQFSNTNFIFGDYKNGILLRTPPSYHLADLYRLAPEDAPYIGFYIFHKPCILLKDPKLIKHILIHDFENFSNRYFAGESQRDSFQLINLFGLRNPVWKYVRSKTIPTFSRTNLKKMLPLMIETGKPLVEYLKEEPVNDRGVKVFDIQDLIYKYASDLIGIVALGVHTNSFKYPNSKHTKFLMSFFRGFKRMTALVTVFFMPKLVDIIGSKILFDSSYLQKIFNATLESREKSGVTKGDYVDSIIKLKNGEQSNIWKFEGDNLFYQSGLFYSGFESSSVTTIYILMEFARNQVYQDRARKEIKEAIGKHGWTYEAFKDMKYLDLCIAESVRLYPSVGNLDRLTHEDYKVPDSDLILKKGTPIFISIYGLHTDPKHFDNPLAFIPDRFEDVKKKSDAYIPFGVGYRMCIGAEIGEMHVKVLLSMILMEFQVYRDSTEIHGLDPRSTFTASANEINVEFKRLPD